MELVFDLAICIVVLLLIDLLLYRKIQFQEQLLIVYDQKIEFIYEKMKDIKEEVDKINKEKQ